jgi:hypothetical protein
LAAERRRFGYRITPLYDVISAEPSKSAHKIRDNQMKLAMAVGGSRHYVIKQVAPRHFLESAVKGGMGRKAAIKVVDELCAEAPVALHRVMANLPAGLHSTKPTDDITNVQLSARSGLLLSDYLQPIDLGCASEQLLGIRRELLSGLAVHVGLAVRFIIKGVEYDESAGLGFVFRRVPRQRAGLLPHQRGLFVQKGFEFRFHSRLGLQLDKKCKFSHLIFPLLMVIRCGQLAARK